MDANLENIVTDVEQKYEKYMWMADFHIPFQDKKLLKSLYQFIEDQEPDLIILGGDIIDFYAVSRFDKNPKRANQLQKEIDQTVSILEDIISVSNNSRIIYLEGNHEVRLPSYLMRNPELYGLRALEVPELLGLPELGIEYMTEFYHKGFLFKHGDYANKYSANKELDVEGVSGMSGHTHRNQMLSKTTRDGVKTWHNIGHLCDVTQADYMTGTANWQQGIGMVYFRKSGRRHHVNMIPIEKGIFIYDEKVYGE